MDGFISVEGMAVTSEAALQGWVDLALAFVNTLPPKGEKRAAKPKKRKV